MNKNNTKLETKIIGARHTCKVRKHHNKNNTDPLLSEGLAKQIR